MTVTLRSTSAQQLKKQAQSSPPNLEKEVKFQQPAPEPIVTACVGKKVSELDDFDFSMPKRPTASNVRPGGFQVGFSVFLEF